MNIILVEDWFKKTPEEQNKDIESIQTIATYLQYSNFPVLTRIYYQTVDYTNRKAIYITEKGEIVER